MHDEEESIRLVERKTGKVSCPFDDIGLRAVESLEFSPDGSQLAAADNYSVVILDLNTRREVARLDKAAGLRGLLRAVGFTADGTCLAVESRSYGGLSVWNVLEKRRACSVAMDKGNHTMMFCRTANHLVTLSCIPAKSIPLGE